MVGVRHILVLTADAGFGHRSAANAVAAALEETFGEACRVEIVNPLEDKRVPTFLRRGQSDYNKVVRDMPELYRFGYEASDASVPTFVIESALTAMLFEALRDLVREHQPSAILLTYPLYQAPLQAVYAIERQHVPSVTVVTDLSTVHRLWFHEVADVCLVPTEQVSELAIKYGLPPAKVCVTGIPVHPDLSRDQRERTVVREQLGWQPDVTTVLAVGSQRVGHLYDVLRALDHSGLAVQLAVVAGGDDALYQQLEHTEWHSPTHVYNFVTNMPELMRGADCMICKAGGLIITEALASGLPMLLVDVLPGQEAGNAEYVTDGGAAELVASPLEALEALFHWLDGEGALLAQRARNARRLGRPRAAYAAGEQVWAVAVRGPDAGDDHLIGKRPKLMELLGRYGIS